MVLQVHGNFELKKENVAKGSWCRR